MSWEVVECHKQCSGNSRQWLLAFSIRFLSSLLRWKTRWTLILLYFICTWRRDIHLLSYCLSANYSPSVICGSLIFSTWFFWLKNQYFTHPSLMTSNISVSRPSPSSCIKWVPGLFFDTIFIVRCKQAAFWTLSSWVLWYWSQLKTIYIQVCVLLQNRW